MIPSLRLYTIATTSLFLLWTPLLAQLPRDINFRDFMKRPETPIEFWEAIRFEIEIGKYDLAAERLKGFLDSLKRLQEDKGEDEANKALLEIEAKYGMSSFLRLIVIPDTRKDGGPLVERMGQVLNKHLSDPARIARFIKNLSATPEERLFAIKELRRSGALAVPHLVRMVIEAKGNPEEQAAILSALPYLYKNSVPPLLAALDADDVVLKLGILDNIKRRGAVEAVPHLWFLYASPRQPPGVNQKAAEVLEFLLDSAPGKLMSAKQALAQEAERWFQHKVKFDDPNQVTVWRWDGKELVSEMVPPSKAEEYFGLRFARQALELDPGYEPAQLAFLSVALEKAYQDVDQPLSKAAPKVKEMLGSVNPDLLATALERALNERRLPIILGTTRALGDVLEIRATRPMGKGLPVLARALYYPDRRVQLAAADALLRIPGPPQTQATNRVVDVLRRTIGTDSVQKVLLADFDKERSTAIAQFIKEAGYEPVVVPTGREAMYRLREAADIDVVLIDQGIPDPDVTYLISQLRADADLGLLPVFILVTADRTGTLPPPLLELRLRRLAERNRNVWVMTAPNPIEMQRSLTERIRETMGRPLTDDERKGHVAQSILWLAKLAAGEIPGYDVRPAEAAVRKALQSGDPAVADRAIEVLGRLTSRTAQRELAGVALDGNRPPKQRSKAAEELVRNLQLQGVVLTNPQVANLQAAAAMAEDADLKANLNLVLSAMRPDARKTGEALRRYQPLPAGAAPPPEKPAEPKKEDKEKER